jgi:hypothetical protein
VSDPSFDYDEGRRDEAALDVLDEAFDPRSDLDFLPVVDFFLAVDFLRSVSSRATRLSNRSTSRFVATPKPVIWFWISLRIKRESSLRDCLLVSNSSLTALEACWRLTSPFFTRSRTTRSA